MSLIGRRPRLILFLAVAGLSLAGATVAAAPSLRFDDAFAAQGEPESLHYLVLFRSAGVVHRMEVWRDGDRRIRRNTDQALTIFASHKPGEAGYHLAVLDRVKHVRTDIERTNLYRIGQFADWFDFGHGLRHPKGAYTLTRLTPAPAMRAIRPCSWYALTQGDRVTNICWDTGYRIPLLITGADGQPQWKVVVADRAVIPPARFAIDDRNYIHDNANADIERD